jgi:CubicO group peptidase (beta-lactamase class C family)
VKSPLGLLLSLALSIVAFAEDEVVVEGETGKALDAALEKAVGDDFWGTILVAKDGKVLLTKGYGSADYEKAPNTPRTLFEIASASKMFTATAILKLEMQGKLSIEDPITKFFKNVPADKKGITVRHLLTHTSGMTVEALLPYQSPETADEFAALAMKAELESKIGEKFAYSNPGYALLGVIIEKASGQTMEKYLRENLFVPAGMKDSGFVQDKELDKKRASTRRDGRTGQDLGSAVEWGWGWGYRGMGGIVTTCWDLYRFDRAMRAGKVLDEAARKKQVTPAQAGYGLGCLIETTDRGTKRMSHSGSVAGYLCNYIRYLDDDAVIIILSNDLCQLGVVGGALADVLFPPLGLTLTVDVKGRKLSDTGGLILKEGASWKATKAQDSVVLSLETKDGSPLKAILPRESAISLSRVMQEMVKERRAAGEKDDGSFEAGVFTLRLPLKDGRCEISNAKYGLMPSYEGVDSKGNDIQDTRLTLIFIDPATGQWPLMAHMSLTAAQELIDALKKASAK